MTGDQIATALRLRRVRDGEWLGQCPCCGYKSGFSVTDRRGGSPLLYCHVSRCSFADIVESLRKLGLWPKRPDRATRGRWRRTTGRAPTSPGDAANAKDADKIEAAAWSIWRRASPIAGSLAETYLRARGITGPLPPANVLRFGYCKHPSDGQRHPTLIAGVAIAGDLSNGVAIHRTFLRADGLGKADFEPNKMSLGPCAGGAVILARPTTLLAIAEGLESALSYMQVTNTPTWAALSAAGMCNLILPATISDIVIAADPDDVGMAAAHAAGHRWLGEGRRVFIACPPPGLDFNDLIRGATR